ncbi:MAG: MBL fold metallo-hydrolase [Alphaproteobacteria bacterium]|jgi:glyoxylase-like metal-dependent hydrolase (beta-lactamase superfamily II)|nr:MBL fold metallo-hydrolase [Alphaproteobacteria bacterium]MDP6515180.1 MBL fold metallo-hydrolase [Alphaproteobacteria bacterium]
MGFELGDISVRRVIETEGPEFDPRRFFPDCDSGALDRHRPWLEPRFLDPASGKLVFAIQSYLLRTRHHTILVDSCVGENKARSYSPDWNMRGDTSYLADLAAAGAPAESIDFVLCTHLHPDHVGWNTRLVDGRWVPTFANAKYIFARDEWAFWRAKSAKHPTKYDDGAIRDSVLPVVEAGQALIVDQDHALDDQVCLEPSPGHTPGHVGIRLASRGQRGVLSGDLIHNVLQCAHPQWSSAACFDKALSARTRQGFLDRAAETDTLVMTAHFPSPSVGHVVRAGDAFGFRFRE